MKTYTYKFIITNPQNKNILKVLLTMALKETELIYGKAKVKLETNYKLYDNRPICLIEGGTESSEHLAKLLSGFLIKEVGEDNFKVERIENTAK